MKREIIFIILAILGGAAFIYVGWLKFNAEKYDNNYTVDSYYIPTVESQEINEKNLYEALTGSSKNQCPNPTLQKSQSLIKIAYSGKYSPKCWVLNNDYVNSSSSVETLSIKQWSSSQGTKGVGDFLKLTNIAYQEASSATLCGSLGDGSYTEIIAPFDFNFVNNNTDSDSDNIVITNKAGTVKITFYDVANWFCAGPPGTDGWEEHKDNHLSIEGSSANAVTNGGSAGSIIGYANGYTSIEIQVNESIGWHNISVKQFLTD